MLMQTPLSSTWFILLIMSLSISQYGGLQAQEDSNISPVVPQIPGIGPNPGFCGLPPSLGYAGTEKLIEDCESLERFKDSLPIERNHYGSAIIICCPESLHKVLFPIDEEPLTTDEEYDYEYDYVDISSPPPKPKGPTCQRKEVCSPATQCSQLEESPSPLRICGWDEGSRNYKVCCEDENRPRSQLNVRTLRKKYECEDFVPECASWASKFPSSCSNYSHISFSFMVKACMHSCGICGEKGCVDEFDRCQDWAKEGHCVDSPRFMSINCRESCGICGHRSVRNNEKQLVNGREYSNLEDSQFFCGRSKLRDFIDNPPVTESTTSESSNKDEIDLIEAIFSRRRKRDLPELKEIGEFFYYQTEADNSRRKIICASTIVSDKFVVSAAHCYINFQGTPLSRINSVIIRDGTNNTEQIEMRRIFIYPSFQLPSLYDDIAVIELGRRIHFDFDTFGDSPSCLDNGRETLVGREATSQGYGFTENKVTSDVLLETTNTIIDNSDCADYLSHNSSRHINYQTRLKRALSSGVNDQLLCTIGIRNETSGIFSGPCEGDSGGPLFVEDQEIKSLAGIVSGGLGCGVNIPKWYTRVSSYLPWIKCIITNAKKYKSQAKVEFFCRAFLQNFEPKNFLYS